MLIKKLSSVRKKLSSEFFLNTAKLTSGTAIAQGVSILTAPILYRIYSKEDYGTLGLYIAILGVIGVFSTFQYTQAILLEKDEQDAIRVLWLNRLINIAFTVLSILFILTFGKSLGWWLGNEKICAWLWFLPISIFFTGQNRIYRTWANRRKNYTLLTFNSILLAGTIPVVSISIGLFKSGPLGLFMGLLVSHILPPVVLHTVLNRTTNFSKFTPNRIQLQELARKWRNFPTFNMPAEFLNRFSNQLPVFMISTFAGAAAVGVYNLCVRMLGLPVHLIAASVGEVFRQRATEEFNRKGHCRNIFVSTAKSLAALSLFPFCIILFFAPDLFAWFFSDEWRDAGIFAQVLALYFALKFTVSPLSYIYYLAHRQREELVLTIYFLISSFLILYYYIPINIKHAILLFGMNYSFIYLFVFFRSYEFSKGYC